MLQMLGVSRTPYPNRAFGVSLERNRVPLLLQYVNPLPLAHKVVSPPPPPPAPILPAPASFTISMDRMSHNHMSHNHDHQITQGQINDHRTNLSVSTYGNRRPPDLSDPVILLRCRLSAENRSHSGRCIHVSTWICLCAARGHSQLNPIADGSISPRSGSSGASSRGNDPIGGQYG